MVLRKYFDFIYKLFMFFKEEIFFLNSFHVYSIEIHLETIGTLNKNFL